MKLAVIGGKLQGTEVAYLAKKAGYEVTVFDKNPDAQAFGLADHCERMDLLADPRATGSSLKGFDVIFPALENMELLCVLQEIGDKLNIPVIFDLDAYKISSSKQKSNTLFQEIGIAMPGEFPDCSYPVILKPDDQSGSKDVKKAYSREEAEEYLANMTGNTVVQEYVEGRSFSIEVIGNGTEYIMPEITEVVIDKEYDCKRIIAPAKITPSERKQMMKMAELLAKSIQIKGIFDIEVISQEGILKILEIDARMPSQTPISVYHSCGINMVELLVQAYTKDTMRCTKSKEKSVMYQQIVVKNSTIHVLGEHVMATCGRLHLEENFFGAEEAITDYSPGKKDFSAIVITTGQTEEKAYDKFLACVNNIKEKLGKQISFIEG